MSFMSPKGHIWMTRYVFDYLKATDKLNTILEPGQIGHEDPTIKNTTFSSQESGTSFMSPKGHIWIARYIFDNLQAIEKCNISNSIYFQRQTHWFCQEHLWI